MRSGQTIVIRGRAFRVRHSSIRWENLPRVKEKCAAEFWVMFVRGKLFSRNPRARLRSHPCKRCLETCAPGSQGRGQLKSYSQSSADLFVSSFQGCGQLKPYANHRLICLSRAFKDVDSWNLIANHRLVGLSRALKDVDSRNLIVNYRLMRYPNAFVAKLPLYVLNGAPATVDQHDMSPPRGSRREVYVASVRARAAAVPGTSHWMTRVKSSIPP